MPDPVSRGSSSIFARFSEKASLYAGKPVAFVGAVLLVLGWAASGPYFQYGETWQLAINTSTTILTFLMVFVIQNSQNRDIAALHIKLNELLLQLEGPRDSLIETEHLGDEEIQSIRDEMHVMAKAAREKADRAPVSQSPDGEIRRSSEPV